MPERIYYILNGLLLAILVAVNIRSRGAYISIMVIYAGLWTGVELVYGAIKDFIAIRSKKK